MEIALVDCYGASPQHRGDLREKQPSLGLKVEQPSTLDTEQHSVQDASYICKERGKQDAKCFQKDPPFRKEKNYCNKSKTFFLPSGRSLLVPVWRRQNTTTSAGRQSTKKINNNNSFSLFACVTRPQFSLQHPVQLVFPLIIINQTCSQIPLQSEQSSPYWDPFDSVETTKNKITEES